jgi:hypothetical protein
MGRTVPSFRVAEAQETTQWKGFRKALPEGDKLVFDEMLSTAKLYTSASSAAVRPSRFEGMTMAIMFHQHKLVTKARDELSEARKRENLG